MAFNLPLNAANLFYKQRNNYYTRKFMMALVGGTFKLLGKRHNIQIINGERLCSYVEKRPHKTPLITVSNHDTMFDDTLLWGCLLPFKSMMRHRMRWTMAANDVCFRSRLMAWIFMSGQSLPVWRSVFCRETGRPLTRGAGIRQPTMDFVLQLLDSGAWLHLYPLGRILYGFEKLREKHWRLRWGVGRLVQDCQTMPLVVPVWHCGFESMSPICAPYGWSTLLKNCSSQRATIFVGDPVQFPLAEELEDDSSEEARRARITDLVQSALYSARTAAIEHHLRFLAAADTGSTTEK